jgi:hypothetical protein
MASGRRVGRRCVACRARSGRNGRSRGLAARGAACYSWRRRPRLCVVGRFFCCRVDLLRSARPNRIRETAMASSKGSATSEHQPKSDPANADMRLFERSTRSYGRHRRVGTPAELWASPMARPDARPVARPVAGSLSIETSPHLDNRRFVKRHQVGQQQMAWPTMASSHSARCAAAGRRSGGLLSHFWETTPDS